MIHDIYLALSELKVVYKSHWKLVTLTSDTLYQQFIELSPLLPPNTVLCEEKQRVLSTLNSTSPRNTGINQIDSQSESTIRSRTNTSTQSRPSRPLVIGKDEKSYPMNPTTNYISRFADEFCGCFGCGSVSHLFRECLEKHNKTMKYKYFQDLNDHVPSTRINKDMPTGQSNLFCSTPCF